MIHKTHKTLSSLRNWKKKENWTPIHSFTNSGSFWIPGGLHFFLLFHSTLKTAFLKTCTTEPPHLISLELSRFIYSHVCMHVGRRRNLVELCIKKQPSLHKPLVLVSSSSSSSLEAVSQRDLRGGPRPGCHHVMWGHSRFPNTYSDLGAIPRPLATSCHPPR